MKDRQNYNKTRSSYYFLLVLKLLSDLIILFLKFFGRHMSFFGSIVTPVLDFW